MSVELDVSRLALTTCLGSGLPFGAVFRGPSVACDVETETRMGVLAAWIQGIIIGLGVAAPIGPVNVEIIRRHLGQGFAAGLLLGLGACSVDTAYMLVISVGLITASPDPATKSVLTVVGAAILVVLAGMILKSAVASASRAVAAEASAGGRISPWRHYVVGVAMTAVNPMNIIFWFGVIVSGTYSVNSQWGPWLIVAGVMCGTVAWVTSLNLALVAGRRFLRPRILLAINVGSAAVLLAMAAISVWPIVVG